MATSEDRQPEPRTLTGESLEGVVRRVVYSNEESGWTVARLAPEARRAGLLASAAARGSMPITVVGRMFGIREGERLRLTGEWVKDRKYGRQFKVQTFLQLRPSTLEGIERYLGSGLVPGVGKVMASRLVERFGLDTLDVIENQSERLSEVEGIGPVRANGIREAWARQKGIREILIFLHGHGLSGRHAARIHKRYGDDALSMIRQDPFRLAEDVFGIGFKSADGIATKVGVARDAPERIAAGVLHVLARSSDRGHVYLPRRRLAEEAAALLETPPPGVQDGIDRLTREGRLHIVPLGPGDEVAVYLPRLEEAEREAAERLGQLLSAPASDLEIDPLRALEWVERRQGLELAGRQRRAVESALTSNVLVITGGPGTGKTTLVRAIVEILGRRGQKVLLAAPTGRAAKRLAEASGLEARTLHRLLEFDPRRLRFQRGRDRPLEADALIVDEASMLDCPLARDLFAAVPDGCRLILVGDVDQLPSVGPGRVLADLIDSGSLPVVRLTEVFRQAARSLIVTNAHRIRRGDLPVSGDRSGLSEFYFFERREPEEVLATLRHLITERIPTGFGLDPKRDIQVLTPMRRGLLGAENLNQELQALLNPLAPRVAGERGRLRIGDRVMQLRNNYDLEVFNGDIGTIRSVTELDARVRVDFDGRPVEYELAETDELALAYACTVHKSQGSEYPCIVMPVHTRHYVMLQRNLLYTGVTRARRLVILVGETRALAVAVGNDRPRSRFTLLARRLRGLIPAPPAGGGGR